MQALLFGAWVCILKYFDWGIYKNRKLFPEDPKADFFKGIAIWAWVMVILLVLTVIFSFDKILQSLLTVDSDGKKVSFVSFAKLLFTSLPSYSHCCSTENFFRGSGSSLSPHVTLLYPLYVLY